jgi:hypothetical protein
MNPKINTFLENQDNAEKIRDQIAALLTLEIANQRQIAIDKNVPDKRDFDIGVYIENARPWELSGDKNPFPLVNVCLQETAEDARPGSTLNNTKYTGQYVIDCYACGNQKLKDENEFLTDDYLATIKAWKTARIVRNILMSGFYAYLGIRQIVQKRSIKKITTIIPPGLSTSAVAITAARIILEVNFFEQSPQAESTELEGISFKSENTGKVVLIDIFGKTSKE